MTINFGDGDDEDVARLSPRQEVVFEEKLEQFKEYLRTKAKNPRKEIGYAERSIGTRVSRVVRGFHWIWETEGVTTELSPDQGDRIIEALETDKIRRRDGDRYSENSKRKLSNALVNWFRFNGHDWEPKISFHDEKSKENADPFTREELKQIWQAALNYKSIKRYNNLIPEERDRWRRHLAQELGKPKDEVEPADWEKVNTDWKIPSIVRTTRCAAWRPALIERMKVDWYDSKAQAIVIPAEYAVKNDTEWTQPLVPEAATSLDRWIEQRSNNPAYDGTDAMWLTRKKNPYSSSSLNDLLRNLMDEADIRERGRNISWYSFRHSLGTYVYDEYKDLEIVAKMLRQNSTASAARYVHPTEELQREAANLL